MNEQPDEEITGWTVAELIGDMRTHLIRLEHITGAKPEAEPDDSDYWLAHPDITDTAGEWLDDGLTSPVIRVPASLGGQRSHVDVEIDYDAMGGADVVVVVSVYCQGAQVDNGDGEGPFPHLDAWMTADECEQLAAALQKAAARIREELAGTNNADD
jgi:hypothetical protein